MGVTKEMIKATALTLQHLAGCNSDRLVLQAMDYSGDGKVSRDEFICFILVKLRKVGPESFVYILLIASYVPG